MPGRTLLPERSAQLRHYHQPDCVRRRAVLRDTLAAFVQAEAPDHYQRLAAANLARWQARAVAANGPLRVEVQAGDWGEVTGAVTARDGHCFAVLNMANAFVPGGGYVEGLVAQEENMFRRTDCHFSIDDHCFDRARDVYHPAFTELLEAADGRVYLDTARPRVCLRGPEQRDRADLGYAWLAQPAIFPFYELRAAATDLRDGSPFSAPEMRRRIAAQLDTLRAHGLRHAVLGAFGCGAFQNPAAQVATLYREEIARRADDFTRIVFAVFHAGYGPDNFQPFAAAFRDFAP
jgi:hypothetical protein